MGLLKKIIPFVLLSIVLIASYLGFKYNSEKTTSAANETKNTSNTIVKSSAEIPPANVVVDLVKVQNFYKQLHTVGSGKAIAAVDLTPWSAGVLDKFFVSSGAKVQEGDLIAKLDSEKEEIAVAKAKIHHDNSALTLSRIMKLRASNTATEIQEITARLELENANLALLDANLALDQRTIRAPISGTVGILPIGVGNAVSSNSVIGRIENRERILVDVWVPEQYASYLHKGDEVTIAPTVQSDKNFVGRIYAIDNMIDAESRTLHVQVELQNEQETLMPGMSFSVIFQFFEGLFPVVDPLAIQWNSKGSFVWRVKNGKVEYVPVSIIQRKADQVFVKADLEKDDQIVIQGVQMLQSGRSVLIQDSKAHQKSLANEQDVQ
ncbi:hypothetical protein X471_00701 [Bartonella bacilliformis str. Heidi Mejia]|uniref:efflux RND transporter periplasmic adaptor subunit n=1 Tax=Bartonella bacilliformis TaxID=774 RepID=UPI000453585B|nr:efflux RND transporter periplasmic adaptor subunit [Bartonella bacilliformis]EYS91815.1 hypothetical protein X471_00701 [Bartonella bacilliformis str. Heidi Mejia]EYS95773.1 hypothetical protein X470_00367 [Bartonella bacilliformis Peru-18]KEG17939.1 hypothetical protein H709_00259 [Bartonella bacilliformis CUSCO5]KEG18528.1 hypothetical protein H707_00249 [Bartonella bacilliformis Hosp800-02]KEG23636.1 hypothetical protein H708_00256 [Bartonella bacilliformis VAB9028]